MDRSQPLAALLAIVLLVGTAPAAGASAAHDATAAQTLDASTDESADNGTVTVGTGAQLATVVSTTAGEIRTEYEHEIVSVQIETGDDESRAEVVADRYAELSERAERVRAEHENVTAAYRAGNVSRATYAQRLATLNARANNVQGSLEELALAAERIPEGELAEENVTVADIEAAESRLSDVRGPGLAAIRSQFIGQSDGEIEIETGGGVSIEVESEDGEQSREFERERGGNGTVAVDREAALDAATSHLTDRGGNWTVAESELDEDDGVYEFEFALSGPNATGEAEASVDASTGSVFAFEEEIEPRDEGDDEREDERDGDEEREAEDGDEAEREDENETEVETDDEGSLELNRSDAVDAARDELSDADGEWTVESVEPDADDGVYEVSFDLDADGASGEAEATVDGATGAVIEFDEDVESESEDETEDDEETEDGEAEDDSDDD